MKDTKSQVGIHSIEFECACFGHRICFEVGEDGELYVNIADRVRGRPKWKEAILWKEDVEKLKEFLK